MFIINRARAFVLLLLAFVTRTNTENLMDGTEIGEKDRHVPVSYELAEEATHRAMQSEPVIFYGRVWYDDNANGTIDFGEEGVSGVKVSLFRKTKYGDKTKYKFLKRYKTNTNGEWEISLRSIKENSEYYVKFIPGKTPHCHSEPFVQGDESAVNNVKRGTSKPGFVEYGGWYEVNAGLRRYCEPPSFPRLDDVYLLIGQSNMVGRAPIDSELGDNDPIPNTWLLRNATDDWVTAKNPLNIYSNYRNRVKPGIGPGYSFSLQMQEVLPGQVGLVVQAVGGTSILQWKRGGRLYENAVQKTRAAMEYGPLRAVLWHQGESDWRHLDGYLDSLATMIANLREDLGISDLPFIAGQLLSSTDKYSYYNDMIVDLPNRVARTAVVLTDNSTGSDDGTHFNRDGQLELGKRYADAMVPFLQLG